MGKEPLRSRPARHGDGAGGRARVAAGAALTWGAVYLLWRAGWTLDGTPRWLSVPLLAAEAWALGQLGLLAVQAWRVPAPAPPLSADDAIEGPIADVLVPARGATLEEVTRTLVGCRNVRHAGTPVVLDSRRRPDVEAYTFSKGARYVVIEGAESNAALIDNALSHTTSEIVAWVDAGDVPMPEWLVSAVGYLADRDVGVVQVAVEYLNRDSLSHLAHGRDEQALANRVVNPALGALGLAPWTGSGSVIRRHMVEEVGGIPAGTALGTHRAAIRLHGRGYGTCFHERPLVRSTAPDSLDDYLTERYRRAVSTLQILRTRDNPLIARGLRPRERAAHFGMVSRYFGGVHRLTLLAVLVATLLTGSLPIHASTLAFALLWAPAWTLSGLASVMLARGTLGVGDRSRHALRTMGVYTGAALSLLRKKPDALLRDGRTASPRRATFDRLRLLAVAVALLDLALLARSLTAWRPSLLPAFSGDTARFAVVAATIWILTPAIDVLQVIARRRQRRSQFRLETDLRVTVGDMPAKAVDLTPNGIGIELVRCPEVGALAPLVVAVPRLAGTVEFVHVDAVAVHVAPAPRGRFRAGFSFVAPSPAAIEVLVEYCSVTHHRGTRADAVADLSRLPTISPEDFRVARGAKARAALALTNALAVVFGSAGTVLGPAGAAYADGVGSVSGNVSAAAGGAIEGICALAVTTAGTWVAVDATDANGDYTLAALAPGSYKVVFQDCRENPEYAMQWWDGASTFEAASTLEIELLGAQVLSVPSSTTVAPGVTSTSAGGSTTSSPDEPSEAPPPGSSTTSSASSSESSTSSTTESTAPPESSTTTATAPPESSTTTATVPPDSTTTEVARSVTRVHGKARSSGFVTARSGDRPATEVAVPPVTAASAPPGSPAQDHTGIDAVLAPGAVVTGTVVDALSSPVEQACVIAVQSGANVGFAGTVADGTYRMVVPAGRYGFYFFYCGSGRDLAPEWYRDAATEDASTPVDVAVGANLPVDALLTDGAIATGRITDETGRPIPGACAVAVTPDALALVAAAPTDASGNYRLVVAPGEYRLLFAVCADSSYYVTELWNGAYTPEESIPVAMVAGPNGRFNASLARGGRVTGRVTGEDGAGLANACVGFFQGRTGAVGANADGSGFFETEAIPAGEYTVWFGPCDDVGLSLTEFYEDAHSYSEADPIDVPVARTVEGIDARLDLGGRITGTVTGAGGAPLERVCVTAVDLSSHRGAGALSGTDGTYTVKVPHGEYRVQFVDCVTGRGYVGGYWGTGAGASRGASEKGPGGDVIRVAAGETEGGVDTQMRPGEPGSISGRVVTATGTPVEGVCASAHLPADTSVEVATGADGRYEIEGLAAGDWFVGFYDCVDPGAGIADPEDPSTALPARWYENAPFSGSMPDPYADGAAFLGVGSGEVLPGIDLCLDCEDKVAEPGDDPRRPPVAPDPGGGEVPPDTEAPAPEAEQPAGGADPSASADDRGAGAQPAPGAMPTGDALTSALRTGLVDAPGREAVTIGDVTEEPERGWAAWLGGLLVGTAGAGIVARSHRRSAP